MNREQHGTQIRVPAVANFMIDSADRTTASPWEFQITKNQNLANGFFTRIGATEVVLEWNLPNIGEVLVSGSQANQSIVFVVSGKGDPITVEFPQAFYTVKSVLDKIVETLNGATTADRFEIQAFPEGGSGIVDTTGTFTSVAAGNGPIFGNLNLTGALPGPSLQPVAPDLRPYRFIDFVAPDLTYNQSVKDATTSLTSQDVIVRWYFSYDNQVSSDAYGYPIYMGYEPFQLRRLYNPPKQIAWTPNMLIGNLGFTVIGTYVSDATTVPPTQAREIVGARMDPNASDTVSSNWLMTLQLSEN